MTSFRNDQPGGKGPMNDARSIPAKNGSTPNRCRSCGVPLDGALAHATDAECVEALRREVERLKLPPGKKTPNGS
jgi:hypothetical protein